MAQRCMEATGHEHGRISLSITLLTWSETSECQFPVTTPGFRHGGWKSGKVPACAGPLERAVQGGLESPSLEASKELLDVALRALVEMLEPQSSGMRRKSEGWETPQDETMSTILYLFLMFDVHTFLGESGRDLQSFRVHFVPAAPDR